VAAPIVVDIAPPSAAQDADLAAAMLDACAAAAGPGGCVLDAHDGIESRAHVVVSFTGGEARVRVEVQPIAEEPVRAREVTFREDDPRLERYRATGLVVAGLVSDVATGTPAAEPPPPPSPPIEVEPPARRVLLYLAGQTGWNQARPWGGAQLGADVTVVAPVFLALSASYAQTWERDGRGIVGQRSAAGIGAGVAAPLVRDRLELRLRVALQLQELRASIEQPSTHREDAAGRGSTGIEGGVDLAFPITSGLAAFAGGRLDWWGGQTTVRVQGAPDETIGAWMVSVALGLNVRFP
jgi:hypothetical protein